MDVNKLAREIIDNVGGKSNVENLTHCATRLRFTLKDESLLNEEVLKSTEGVLGTANAGGVFQVIIGNQVPKVYAAITSEGDFAAEGESSDGSNKKFVEKLLSFVSEVFTPILPAIIGAGLIKSVLAIGVLLGIDTTGNTYYFVNFIGDAPLYFLPIMLAFTAAKKLNVNQFLAVAVAGAMIHPSYVALVTDAFNINFTSFLGLPVTLATYTSSVLPVLFMVFAMKYVDMILEKVISQMLKFFFKPLFTILIVSLITFVVLGPLGFIVGVGISTGLDMLTSYNSWIVPTIIGAIFPLMVTTGMHYGLVPFMIQGYATVGYEVIATPGNLPSNIAQGADALSVALRTKNPTMKKTGFTTGATALLGITEPALFAVTLKSRKVLYCVMAGGALGGLYNGITGVKGYAFCAPGLLSLPAFVGPEGWTNVTNAIISMIIAFIATFALVFVWGYKDLEGTEEVVAFSHEESGIFSPLSGEVVDLSEVPDETFAQGMMGEGIAIKPDSNEVVAPFDGEIVSIFPTKHAIGLKSVNGVEVLIHIGIDTVNLKGEHFELFKKAGDKVKKGDLIVKCDFDAIKKAGYETITPVIITNSKNYSNIDKLKLGKVSTKELLIKI